MSISEFSLKHPTLIISAIILLVVLGLFSLFHLSIDLFPDIDVPILSISTNYPSASAQEIEKSVTNQLERAINGVPGIKSVHSESREEHSKIYVQFDENVNLIAIEQEIRDRVNLAKQKLPADAENSTIQKILLNNDPVLTISVETKLSKLSKLSKLEQSKFIRNDIQPQLEKINHVGLVDILGEKRREIHVELDQHKLYRYGLTATDVSQAIAKSGQGMPLGKVTVGGAENSFRATRAYRTIEEIGSIPIQSSGDVPVTINNVAEVKNGQANATIKSYVNGEPTILIKVYRQVGSNVMEVAELVKKRMVQLNAEYKQKNIPISLKVVRDHSKIIRSSINDVTESTILGILLTVLVVYLFLGSFRSTFIASVSLPISLCGTFCLMYVTGFSLNGMSLLAINLAVGLLVDDAIVVRENIFRHVMMGKLPKEAAVDGTKEVLVAVVATTLTIVSVFLPIAFMHGIIGGFFREFGLTVCFAVIISLIESLTVAPMFSAHLTFSLAEKRQGGLFFEKTQQYQTKLTKGYVSLLALLLRYPWKTLLGTLVVFILSLLCVSGIPTAFVPAANNGEFSVSVEAKSETSLGAMDAKMKLIMAFIRKQPEVRTSIGIVGEWEESNRGNIYVKLVPLALRSVTTTQFEDKLRNELKQFYPLKLVVGDVDAIHAERALNVLIKGDNILQLKTIAGQVLEFLKKDENLIDVEMSEKRGKPEIQIQPLPRQISRFGMDTMTLNEELRTLIQGHEAGRFFEKGQDYPIMVRLQANQRNLNKDFSHFMIPNTNHRLIPLSEVVQLRKTYQTMIINHQDRQRYIQISADLAIHGAGIKQAIQHIDNIFSQKINLPSGMSYQYGGQTDSFNQLLTNTLIALGLGILFIYLTLATLYESFKTPLLMLLVLPLAATGVFFSLYMTHSTLDLFSMIGCILLLGIATKNSILYMDYVKKIMQNEVPLVAALLEAGKVRLRPILMTSFALIFGMLPVAIGFGEISQQRTSMGIAVIGGLVSSTLLTLVIIPVAYVALDQVKNWFSKIAGQIYEPIKFILTEKNT